MKMSAVVQDVTIRASSEGVDQAAASAERLARAGDAAAASGETQSRSALSVQRAYERLQRQIDMNYRQQQLFEQGQRTLDRALQQTHISAEEHARSLALLQARYGATAAAVNDNVAPISRFQKATGLAAHDVQNLGFQLNDVAVSLASGQSFFTVMVQQGAQILPILSSAPGGIGGALAGIGRYLLSLVTPATAAATALALIGTLGIVGLIRYGEEIEALEKSLSGLGRSTPATAAGLSRIAEAAAAQAKVTTSAARETAAALASTGQIGLSNFEGLIAISKRFADALNLDVTEANKQLAASFADPVKGADDLNGKLNFLSDATRSYIRELAAQNDQTGAQRALLDALGPALANATANTSLLGRAWAYVASAARGAAEAIAQALKGPSPEQELVNQRQYLKDVSTGLLARTPTGQAKIKEAEADLFKLEEQYRRNSAAASAAAKAMADDAAANKVSVQAGDIVRALDPLASKYDELRQKQAVLKQALETPAKLSDPKAAQDAYEAYGRAIATLTDGQGKLISSTELLRQKDALAIEAKKASTDAEKATIAERQKALDLVGEVISKEEAARRVAHAGAMERIKDAKASGAAANDNADAFDNALQRSRDQIEEFRLQQEAASKATIEVYKLTEANRLRRAANQAGRGDEAGMAELIDKTSDAYARQRKATEEAIDAQRRMQDSVRELAEDFASFVKDLASGRGLESALKSLGQTYMNNALDALLTGKGPFAQALGLSPTEKGGVGGIFNFDYEKMAKSVGKGFEIGVGNVSRDQDKGRDTGSGSTGAKSGSTFGNLAGAGLALLGSYSAGYSSQSPLMGGVSGAMAGAAAGASFGAFGGPIGALIGAGAGILGGIMGQQQAKKKRRQEMMQLLQQYQEEWEQLKPQADIFIRQMSGETVGSLETRLKDAQTQAAQTAEAAGKAGDSAAVERINKALDAFNQRTQREFVDSIDGMMASLRNGTGPNSPFNQARNAMAAMGEELLGFVADVKYVSGEYSSAAAEASQAAADYAIDSLKTTEPLSYVQQRLQEIAGAASSLDEILRELGYSAEYAAYAVEQGTKEAIDQLRQAFERDITAKTYDAQGYGYYNEAQSLIDEVAQLREDASSLGLSQEGIDAYFKAAAQSIVDGADLTGSAFYEFLSLFPEFAAVVSQAGQAVNETQRAIENATRRLQYQDRLFAALNDTATLEGQLAAFDRQAQRDREAEMKAGGDEILALEEVIAAERLKIITTYYKDMQEKERRALEDAQNFFDSFSRNLREFVDGLRTGSQSPLSPEARLQAAQAQYNAQLALAQGGDRDAVNNLTKYASDLIDAAKGFYASSAGYQQVFETVTAQLLALPTQVSAEQFIVDAIEENTQETVDATEFMRDYLGGVLSAGNPQAIANALSAYFNTIDASLDGLVSYAELVAALGSTYNTGTLSQIFRELDTNGDGQLGLLELIKYATQSTSSNTAEANSLQNSAISLASTANSLQSSANALASTMTSLLTAISNLNSTQVSTLNALNSQFSLTSSLTIKGSSVNNNMVTALNKIAYNTAYIMQYTGSSGGFGADNVGAYAAGGWIRGPGSATSDSIPIWASNGEFMVNADAARRHAAMLEAINGGADLADIAPIARPQLAPVPVFVPPPANQNGGDSREVVAELRRLNARIAQLEQRLVEAEYGAAGLVAGEVAGVRQEQRRAAADARQDRNRPSRSDSRAA